MQRKASEISHRRKVTETQGLQKLSWHLKGFRLTWLFTSNTSHHHHNHHYHHHQHHYCQHHHHQHHDHHQLQELGWHMDGRNWRPIHSSGPSRIQMWPVLWTHRALNADKYIEINLKWTPRSILSLLVIRTMEMQTTQIDKDRIHAKKGLLTVAITALVKNTIIQCCFNQPMAFTWEMDRCFFIWTYDI